jgi:hypothetical protein
MLTWVIFGDDWGAHPSTTQHLARNLPSGDRFVWVNSLGMRAPRPSVSDAKAIAGRLRKRALDGEPTAVTGAPRDGEPQSVVSVPIAPFHGSKAARFFNRRMVQSNIARALDQLGARETVLVSATPVAAWYVDPRRFSRIAYLRLDDYARLPGVDPAIIRASEPRMREIADVLVATARGLLFDDPRALYLPQGVDADHFAAVPTLPPRSRVLGFFGLLAEWIDYELIERVADRRPDWTIELMGPVRHVPERILRHPRIVMRSRVEYSALPDAIAHWDAAWVPFQVDELTLAVNPVKLREYLAAGLPTFSTPLPSSAEVSAVTIGADADAVAAWLDGEVSQDTVHARTHRRDSVRPDAWSARAATLRAALAVQSRAA